MNRRKFLTALSGLVVFPLAARLLPKEKSKEFVLCPDVDVEAVKSRFWNTRRFPDTTSSELETLMREVNKRARREMPLTLILSQEDYLKLC